MSRKYLLLLAIATLAAFTVLFLLPTNSPPPSNSLLPNLKPEKIERITITSNNQTTTLIAKEGNWFVAERANYPADSPRILRFLRQIWELRPIQTLQTTPADLPQLGLSISPTPSPTPLSSENQNQENKEPHSPRDTQPILISFYDSSNNQLANITLGKFHSPSQSSFDFPSPPIGRYLLTSSSPKVALVKETFFDISPNPADWLNKQFFQTGNLTSIQWIPADQQPAWTLSKTNDQWQLDNPPPNQTADPNKISLATSSLANPFFNDVLPQPKPDDIEGTLILKNDNNVILTLIIGKEKDGNRPISISATAPPDAQPQPNLSDFQKFSGYTYLVPSYLLQNLLIPRNDFFTTTQQSEPQPNPEPSPTPSSVTTEPLSAPTN